MKVFVSGSKSVNALDPKVISILTEYMKEGAEFLVGDCYGVDTEIQKFFAQRQYSNVTVYHMGNQPRHLVSNFSTKKIIAYGVSGYRWYQMKDIAMTNDADIGIAIWDGVSRGTRDNIQRLDNQGKKVIVIRQ